MAKKQLSFAEKAKSKKDGQELSYVKLVRSVKTKSGENWRFNEQILAMKKGENIDSALKRMSENEKLMQAKLPSIKKEAEIAEPAEKESASSSKEQAVSEPAAPAKTKEPAKKSNTEEKENAGVETSAEQADEQVSKEAAEVPENDPVSDAAVETNTESKTEEKA